MQVLSLSAASTRDDHTWNSEASLPHCFVLVRYREILGCFKHIIFRHKNMEY
jgi:hypothetical protein